ncbi:MAG: MbnP family protein [Bacteroidia bacterium]
MSVFFACRKQSYPPKISKAKFNIVLASGKDSPIEWNAIKYKNAAENSYSVTKIDLYISNVILKQSDGSVFTSKEVFYVDAADVKKSFFMLDSIPPGIYTEISFLLGLDSNTNISYTLPSTTENLNMAWPDMMGGGYHFLKFEGHFMDSTSTQKGFAIHLGKNENLPKISFTSTLNQKYWDHDYSLTFDLNEVFANPHTYDLDKDNNYTMMDSVAMNKIMLNISDAFSLKQNK